MTLVRNGDLICVRHPYYFTAVVTLCSWDGGEPLDEDTPVTCFKCLVRRDQLRLELAVIGAGR